MSARAELRSYVEQLRNRLRTSALVRGVAVFTASALLATVLLVAVANLFGFSSASVWSARGALWLALVAAAAFGLVLPLWRVSVRRSARRAEQVFPQFGERLATFAERDRDGEPFLELLAADTLRIARAASPKHMVPDGVLAALAGLALASVAVLIWLVRAGPGYWGYGAAALWTGTPSTPPYAIRVMPGDAAVRRNGDQLVIAEPLGMQVSQVRLHARFGRASRWESVAMEPQPTGSGFEFLLAGIPDDVEYYIDAGSVSSQHFRLRVADVPAVEHIRVRLHYPTWTKVADSVADQSGDVRAVAGTEASIEVTTDRPLAQGALVLDDGQEIALARTAMQGSARGEHYLGMIRIAHDGAYHVATRIGGKPVRISEDYFIESEPVQPPQVAIVRPTGDYHASPIEEVTVGTTASDAFGLQGLVLHYSLNGAAERAVPLLPQADAKQASGTTVISLESLKASPGDVVSVYATAKDARAEARTDIAFIQVDPFEREFSQSQQAGGGGGGFGSGQAQITEREKEIISATWKQAGIDSPEPRQSAEQAKFLSEAQGTLRSQSEALAGRVQLRELTSGNEAIQRFQQEMSAAAEAMQPAARLLESEHWRDALPPEQQALEHLLRAEATFRQIQVAFGSVGGGGGAPNSAGRDLASLFDLELDQQKNSYETRQDAQSSSGHANDLDDVLRRLDEIARRQQALAAAGANAASTAEQRWQEEMLRRSAEELRQEVEQLSRNEAGQSGSSGSASGQQSGAAGTASGAGTSNASNAASAAAAVERLREAEADMRRAVDQHDAAGARSAAERLREAVAALGGLKQQQSESQLGDLSQEAGRLADEERRQAGQMREAAGALGMGGMPGSRGLPGRAGQTYPGGLPGFGPGPPWARGSAGAQGLGGAHGAPDSAGLQSLIAERQKLADDLARLEAGMRNAERETLPRSRAAASKLRDALNDLDQADTETQLQRSADMMRRGYLNGDESDESDIESTLRHLADQIGEAGTALARGTQSSADDALASVGRLRDQIAALEQGMQAGSGGAQGSGTQPGGGQQGDAQRGGPGGAQRGGVNGASGALTGPVTAGGGGRAGWVNGGWDTGVDPAQRGQADAARRAGAGFVNSGAGVGADPERNFQQSLGELGTLRRAVGDDPQSRREVDELIRAMQRLDPRRFPGDPAVEQELLGRVLSQVDQLQLELSRGAEGAALAGVRSDRPLDVPPGYQQAVADYYRRLSQSAH